MTERAPNQPSTPPTTASSDTTRCCSARRDGEFNSLYAIHRVGMKVVRWWADGVQKSVCSVFNIGMNKRRHGRLKRLNEQPNNQAPYWLPQVPVRQTTDPAVQKGELNSLYAIHRVGMEVRRWWSDGVQNIVCSAANIGTKKAIVVCTLSDWT